MKTIEHFKKLRGWFPSDPALAATNQKTKISNIKQPPTLRERLVGGLGASGFGLILMGVFFYFVPNYPKQANLALILTGATLLLAALFVSRTNKH